MLILIPPSEGKSDTPGSMTFAEACPAWSGDTAAVQKLLRKLPAAERLKWYGVRDAAKAKAWHEAHTAALETPGTAAIERYTGVVYQHLDYPSLRNKAAARERLVVVSALFGLIPAGTPIPVYKLAMNPTLARFWKPINTARLEALAAGQPVLNLLSQSYAKAIGYGPLLTPEFRVGGGKKSAGHFGKAIKGRFIRFLIEEDIKHAEDFARFREEGYRWNGQDFVQA
jgi:cytoplasmic iron level regulating protein YaaA (DUF328/UPF0246 family)